MQSLPVEILTIIIEALPLDQLVRSRRVSRGWKKVLPLPLIR